MNREIKIALFATTIFTMELSAKPQSDIRPNVIVIFADDMGSGDLSILNKNAKFKTPNIDALAKSGVSFTDAHTVSSVSTPSRYGILTGEYSWRSSLKAGVLRGHSPALIPADKPTIATMMRRNGYTTACVGKWHLGWEWATNDGKPANRTLSNVMYDTPIQNGPTTLGFDYFYGLPASLDMPPYVTIEGDLVENLPDAEYSVTTFNQCDNDLVENPFLRAGSYVDGEGPETFLSKFTGRVKELISKYNREKSPFFIYFALTAPHAPLAPSKEFEGSSGIGKYGDLMLEVDHTVGEVVDHLKREGLLENTVIILSSDNGAERYAYYRLGESGHNSSGEYKGVKRDLWEGGHRVPFIISWKGHMPKRKVVSETICVSDVYATISDIVGDTRGELEARDSYSLLPLITKNSVYEREYTIHHSSSGRFAIRKDGWVLIENGLGDDNRMLSKIDYYDLQGYNISGILPDGELFNLDTDPCQRVSVYDENPQKVAELTAILDNITDGWSTRRD